MISRVATFHSIAPLMDRNMQTQARLADAQAQQASGLRSESFSGIASDTSALLTFNRQISALEADAAKSTTFSQMVDTAYSTLGDIADLAASMQAQITAQKSNAGLDSDTLSATAGDWMDDLQALMNTQMSGRYLFSGAATETTPVDLQSYAPSASDIDLSYYEGAQSGLSLSLSTGQTLSIGVAADNPGFEKILRAAALVRDSAGDDDALDAAYDLMGEAIDDLGAAQESISSTASSLERAASLRSAQLDAIKGFSSDLSDSDLSEATVLITQYQTQLEAAYSSLTTLLKLNLLDYL